jgi:hypothetical protein
MMGSLYHFKVVGGEQTKLLLLCLLELTSSCLVINQLNFFDS